MADESRAELERLVAARLGAVVPQLLSLAEHRRRQAELWEIEQALGVPLGPAESVQIFTVSTDFR